MYEYLIFKSESTPKSIDKLKTVGINQRGTVNKYSGKPFESFPCELNHLNIDIEKELETKDEIIYEYTTTVQIKVAKIKEL